jgi:phage regulator Rha-like protein
MAKSKTSSKAGLPRIFTVRKLKVVMDSDLAKLYGVEIRELNQAVRRNSKKFPPTFCFQLTDQEETNLKSQIAISSSEAASRLRSQIVILKKSRGGHRKYRALVFTEHGALMAATVLRSARAVQMSVYLINAFVEMREALLANATILKRLAEIDHRLVEHDSVLREVIDRLQPLLDAPDVDEDPKKKIGFHQGNR